jgi:hypothetical protein
MKRREMLLTTGAAVLGASAFPFGWVAAAEKKKQKVLYFTRSAGYEHFAVARRGEELSLSEKALTEWGQKASFEVVCSKDGAVFDGDLDQYDAFIFYTSGMLTGKCAKPQPGQPMSPEGKDKFLAAIEAGKGFVGIHACTDSFRGQGIDPYIAMVGGEFVVHGEQQKAPMKVASPHFPGVEGLGDAFSIFEEWYVLHKFAKDLHVILVQETGHMKGPVYQRPSYPATWARMQGKGRVFYTSMGHESIWRTLPFRQVLLGGIAWALHNVDADVPPNVAQVTPQALAAKK